MLDAIALPVFHHLDVLILPLNAGAPERFQSVAVKPADMSGASGAVSQQRHLLSDQQAGWIEDHLAAQEARDAKALIAHLSSSPDAYHKQSATIVSETQTFPVAVRSGEQVSRDLAKQTTVVLERKSDTATGLPRLKFLSNDTAIRVDPLSYPASAEGQLKDIIFTVTGRSALPIDKNWLREQERSLSSGAKTDLEIRQELAKSEADKGRYDQAFQNIHGYAPSAEDRAHAATVIGNGASYWQYCWTEAHKDAVAGQLRNMVNTVQGRPYRESDESWVRAQQDALANGTQSFQQSREAMARWTAESGGYDSIFEGIHGQPPTSADRDHAVEVISNGASYWQYRWEEIQTERTGRELREIYSEVHGQGPGITDIQNARQQLENGLSCWQYRWAQINSDQATEEYRNILLGMTGSDPIVEDVKRLQSELSSGKTLSDIFGSEIFTNPSVDGPNLKMNTQGIVNGAPQYYDEFPALAGGSSPDWGVIQWNGQSPLDPAAGTSSQVWDKQYGASVGHWTQGSATSAAGKTDYTVFRDPDDGHFVYQMAAQGGDFLDVQLSSTRSVDHIYSFNHQITASFEQGITGYRGSTGVYQAGMNFNINFHSKNLSFGIFLQFEGVDYKGKPESYASFPYSLGGSIYNVSGVQAAYINPQQSSNDGVMFKTTIDVNQGLMAAIRALKNVYPNLTDEVKNLDNWYLAGTYIGVETIGAGLSTDFTGKYTVKDPVVTYDRSKNISYADISNAAPIVSMSPVAR